MLPGDAVLPLVDVKDCTKAALVGMQRAKKFHSTGDPATDVHMIIVLLRLAVVDTDCLFTVNIPQSATGSEEAPVLTIASFTEVHSKDSVSNDHPAVQALRILLETFGVVDWSLFA